MKFGFFDDPNKEYVITTPKTPLPWINYLGSNNFFSLISNTCGGYSFYKDAKLLRLTRYRYNNIPNDEGGRYYYIKDGNTVWNPGWQPVKAELDSYECRHGMGYSRFTSVKNGLKASLLAFVPVNDNCEVNQLTLTNESNEKKSFSVFSYIEFCLWNAMDDMTNYQRNLNIGEGEVIDSTIYHKTEYRERRNHFAVYSVNCPVDGFDTSRDEFLGAYRGVTDPQVVAEGKSHNSVASGWYPIGSHQINITLEPGESKSLIFVLGYCENPEDQKFTAPNVINKKPADELLAKYQTDAQVDAALAELKENWENLLSKFTVRSDEEKLDRMVNIWNQYQCMVTFNMSRSASYYESGIGRGMGFRDSCQDLLGFVHLIPERARERIIDIASTQFEDGSAYHQYQPLTKKGNADIGSGFNDDPLWLIAGTSAYIRETGDTSILEEMVPFDNDESKAVPLMEHLKRSFDYIVNHKGPHNLPLIGRADWNDCLNLNCFSEHPGESFQTFGPSEGPVAESVFIGGMFVKYGKEYADLCAYTGNQAEADRALAEVEAMNKAVLADGWDGEWFVRAYDAQSNKVGCAETVIGRGNRAFEIYKKTCPAYIEDISEIHCTEPYVYSQMIAGKDAHFFGQAKNSWLTGTAAWTFVNVSQYILGVVPTLNGLSVDPCIPSEMGTSFTMTRKYREGVYNIKVENPNKVEKGVAKIVVDGKEYTGTTVIPYEKGKTSYDVTIVMG